MLNCFTGLKCAYLSSSEEETGATYWSNDTLLETLGQGSFFKNHATRSPIASYRLLAALFVLRTALLNWRAEMTTRLTVCKSISTSLSRTITVRLLNAITTKGPTLGQAGYPVERAERTDLHTQRRRNGRRGPRGQGHALYIFPQRERWVMKGSGSTKRVDRE